MAVRRLLVTAVLLAGFLALGGHQPSAALSCSEWPLDHALRDAEIVFIGTQLDPSLKGDDQEHVFATFEVESVIQGDVPERLDLVLDPWAGPAQRDSRGREVVFAYTGSDGAVHQSAGCAPPATPSGVERMLETVPLVESNEPAAALLIGDLGWADIATIDKEGRITGLAFVPEVRFGAIVCDGSALAFTGEQTIDIRTLDIVATYPDIDGSIWCAGSDPAEMEIVSLTSGRNPEVLHHADGRTTRGTFARDHDWDNRGNWVVNRQGDVLMTWRATSNQPAEIEILRRGEKRAEPIVEFGAEDLPRNSALAPSGERIAVTIATAAYLYDDSHSHRIDVFDTASGANIATIQLLGDDGQPIEVIDSAETLYAQIPRPYESIGPPLWIDDEHVAVERQGDSRQLDVYDIESGERVSSTPLDASVRLWTYPHAEIPARSIAFFEDGEMQIIDLPADFRGSADLVFDGPIVLPTGTLNIPTLRAPTPLPADTTTTVEPAEPESAIEAPAEESEEPPEPEEGTGSVLLVATIGLVAVVGLWLAARRNRNGGAG